MTLQYVHTALCLALSWACFCRLVHTNRETLWSVRAGIFAMCCAALTFAMAPWAWGADTSWFVVGLVASVLAMQIATSRFWHMGVPEHFQKRDCYVR